MKGQATILNKGVANRIPRGKRKRRKLIRTFKDGVTPNFYPFQTQIFDSRSYFE